MKLLLNLRASKGGVKQVSSVILLLSPLLSAHMRYLYLQNSILIFKGRATGVKFRV